MLRASLVLLLISLPSFAQVERASIVGSITDKSGAQMASVEIAVTNEATNSVVRLATDDAGTFSVVNLMPGSYTVQASRAGFRNVVYRNYVLQVSQAARLDVQMELGDVSQAVEVTGAAPLLQTENASVETCSNSHRRASGPSSE